MPSLSEKKKIISIPKGRAAFVTAIVLAVFSVLYSIVPFLTMQPDAEELSEAAFVLIFFAAEILSFALLIVLSKVKTEGLYLSPAVLLLGAAAAAASNFIVPETQTAGGAGLIAFAASSVALIFSVLFFSKRKAKIGAVLSGILLILSGPAIIIGLAASGAFDRLIDFYGLQLVFCAVLLAFYGVSFLMFACRKYLVLETEKGESKTEIKARLTEIKEKEKSDKAEAKISAKNRYVLSKKTFITAAALMLIGAVLSIVSAAVGGSVLPVDPSYASPELVVATVLLIAASAVTALLLYKAKRHLWISNLLFAVAVTCMFISLSTDGNSAANVAVTVIFPVFGFTTFTCLAVFTPVLGVSLCGGRRLRPARAMNVIYASLYLAVLAICTVYFSLYVSGAGAEKTAAVTSWYLNVAAFLICYFGMTFGHLGKCDTYTKAEYAEYLAEVKAARLEKQRLASEERRLRAEIAAAEREKQLLAAEQERARIAEERRIAAEKLAEQRRIAELKRAEEKEKADREKQRLLEEDAAKRAEQARILAETNEKLSLERSEEGGQIAARAYAVTATYVAESSPQVKTVSSEKIYSEQEKAEARRTLQNEISRKKTFVCLLLNLVTFGIYNFFWQYKIVCQIRALSGESKKGAGDEVALMFFFGGLYNAYWYSNAARKLSEGAKRIGMKLKLNPLLFAVLGFLTFGIVCQAIVQHYLNSAADFIGHDGESAVEESASLSVKKPKAAYVIFLLTLVTFGIYYLIWTYSVLRSVKTVTRQSGGAVKEFLCMLLVPFYGLFYAVTRSEALCTAAKQAGARTSDNTVFAVLFALVGLIPVSLWLLQENLNAYCVEI